jgi:hypothetical protein
VLYFMRQSAQTNVQLGIEKKRYFPSREALFSLGG